MGKPRRKPPPNMLLLRSEQCITSEDADVGLVGTATLPAADVERLQSQYIALVPDIGKKLPKIGVLGGPIGSGFVIESDGKCAAASARTQGSAAEEEDSCVTQSSSGIAQPSRTTSLGSVNIYDGSVKTQITESPHHGDTFPARAQAGDAGGHTGSVTAEIVLFRNPPPGSPVTLIIGLCRIKVFGRVLETATAMGVKVFHVINTQRTEPAYWTSRSTDPDFIQARLVAGLEQAVDTVMPEVHVWKDTEAFFKTELPRVADGAVNLVAHPSPTAQECPMAMRSPCNLAIGPEGGFVDSEIERLSELSFQPLSLGPRILPVETAVHVLLGKLCF